MAYQHLEDFGRRLDRINKRHGKMSTGYVTVMNTDGLLVSKPRGISGFRFPWRIVALLAVMFIVFKAILMAGLGAAEYKSRALSLQAGTTVEQFGAWAMQPDPVTNWIAEQIRAIM